MLEGSPRDIRITLERTASRETLRAILSVRPHGGDWLDAAESCAGVPSAHHRSDLDSALRNLADLDPDPSLPLRIGRRLAETALPGEVRGRLLHELSLSLPAPARLWLDIRDDELAALPWELLYLDDRLPGSGAGLAPIGHAALHPALHLLRRAETGGRAAPTEPLAVSPLRILVACANPGSPAYPRLTSAEAELDRLRAAAHPAAVVEVVHGATHSSLRQALNRVRPHVFHFIGHGAVLPSGAALALEGNRAGTDDLLYSSELAEWLSDSSVRLAVLSACRLGHGQHGAASDLTKTGLQAVVAMQLPLRDGSAPLFAGAFYSALVSGCTLEESVRQARTAVRGVGPDWSSPVVALAALTGDLFRFPSVRPEAVHTNIPFRKSPFFVGRAPLVSRIASALGHRPVALFGASGLGKTMLAAEFAHAHMDRFPGGVYWIQASSSQLIRESYAAVGQRFFDIPEEVSAESAARRTLDRLQELDRPALLIFDDLVDDRHLLMPATGPCRILVTTKLSHLWEAGFENVKVPDLDEASSLDLLQIHRPARTPAEKEAARQIAAKLGHLPHALSLVAHSVKRHGIGFTQYLERLPKSRDLNSIFDPIRLSWQAAGQRSRTLLQTAACFAAQPLSADLLYRASGFKSQESLESGLEGLERRSLIGRDTDGRLSIHSLVSLFAREHTTSAKRCEMTARAASVLTEALRSANDAVDWRTVRSDLPHAREIADACKQQGLDGLRAPLLRELGVYAAEHGEFPSALAYLRESLETAERAFGNRSIEAASCHRRLAEVLQLRGDSAAALREARTAYRIARSLLGPDDRNRADYLNTLGWILKKADRLGRALPFYRAALALNERVHGRDHPDTLVCLNNIGMLLLAVDTEEARTEALAYLRQTLAVAESTLDSDHAALAAYHNNLGQTLQRMGTPESWQEALQHHLAALSVSESAHGEPHPDSAAALYYSAECCRALGRLPEALAHSESAVPLYVRFFGENDRRTMTARNQARQLRLEVEHAAT